MKHSHFNRIISMFIAFAMLLTMVPAFAANASQFVDFPTGWSKAAMTFSVDNGLLNGKSANKIEPASNLTRAEMATIINRAFGAEVKGDISSYNDVSTSDWFYTEMQKAVNMQTFKGDGNGKLRPNSDITREEVMTAIARAIVLETTDYSSIAKFKDYSSVSDWAKPYVATLIANGYVNGYEDNTVKPKANITREEFAQLMYNIFKTYLTVRGTTYTSVYNQNCVMINNKNINLSNVTVYGDLVLGDGVGTSQINLTNVTIKGRLVARGGIITLKNVTTGGGVVVKNVNGTTHFNNYRTDAVFNGVIEHTYATYLTPTFVPGGGNRPSGSRPTVDVVYNLDLVENGGTYAFGFTEPAKYTSGKEFVLPTSSQITKTGHTFGGWYEQADFSGNPVEKISVNETGDKTYYAKWIPNVYDLVLDTNGGTIAADYNNGVTDKYTYAEELVLPTDTQITKDNHQFAGWYEESDFSGERVYKIPANAIDTKTYYAKWTYVDPTVKHTVKFYALPKDTKNSTFVGELEIVSGGKFDFAQDGYISDDIKQLYREADGTVQKIGYELWDETVSSGPSMRNLIKAGYYDAQEGYQHYIRPDLVYHNGSKWVPFTGDTKVTSNMDVYAVTKQIQLYVDGTILGYKLPIGLTFGTPYNSATRAVDSLKDAMYIAMYDKDNPTLKIALDRFEQIYGKSIEDVIFNKIAPKSKGIIDENGYLQNVEFSMLISQVISVDEIEKEIRNYLTTILEKGTEDEIRQLVELVHLETFIDHIGIPTLAELVGYNVVRDAVMSADNRDTLIKYIQDQLAAESNDFRNILLGNTAFLEAALSSSDIKDAVIDAIIANPDILINVINVGTNKETFINEAVKQPAFINALLSNDIFKAKVIDLIHGEDKASLIGLIEEDVKVRDSIIAELRAYDKTHNHIIEDYLETDKLFKAKIIEKINVKDLKVEDRYKTIIDALKDNASFKAAVIDLAGTTLDDDQYSDLIDDYIYSDDDTTVNGKITKYINDTLTNFNADDNTGINKAINDYMIEIIDDYIEAQSSASVEYGTQLDEAVIVVVNEYLENQITDGDVIAIIDEIIINYIKKHINLTEDEWDTVNDTDLEGFVSTLKSHLIEKAVDEPLNDNLKGIIKGFVSDVNNKTVITNLFNTYYDTMKSYIVDNVNDSTVNPELHKIIKAQAKADNTYNILSTFIAENEVYIKQTVLADEELKKYIEKFANDGTFKTFVTEKVTTDTVVKFVLDIRVPDPENPNQLSDFIDEAINMLKGLDYYKNFIKCFSNKEATYHIDKSDIHFALAVGEAVHGYTFDEALQLLGGGPVYELINRIGKDKFEDIYNKSRDEFNNGIIAISDKIFGNAEKGIVADETYSEEYPMSLAMRIDFASLIDTYYTKLYDKLVKKIEDVAPYYYTENQYLKQFVEGFKFIEYFDKNDAEVTEVNSGYKFKTIKEYYELMYNNLLLIDKAVLWYGPNTPDGLENLRDDIANDIIKAFNKLQQLLEGLDEDGLIFGSYTIKDVIARVESLKKLGAQVPALTTVIDNVCTILSKVEGGEVIAGGYTLDELAKLSDRLESAVAALRDEEYEKLNSELEDIINKAISKADEIIKELDENGTILGKVSLDELMAKVDVVNNIYKKLESKIDAVIGKLADIEAGSVSGKFDTKYWEDVLFGKDDYNRFDLDDILDAAAPHLSKIRVDNPYTDDNKRLVIDEYKVNGGGATATFDRYMN